MKKFTRRDFFSRVALPSAAAVTAGMMLPTGCGSKDFSTDPNMPNILFMTADNLGWHDLSLYGNTNISTPNIDSIGKEGAKFERVFCVSSSCAPSRASFLTGQYPHTHGVNALTHLQKTKALSPFHTTLADLLKKAGYNTAHQGKWHVSPYLPTSWYGYNERLSGLLPDAQIIRDSKDTIDFLKRNRNNRFYLEVNYTNSHRNRVGEYEMQPEFPVDWKKVKVPGYMAMPQWPEIRKDLARYYSENLQMEKMIGEVLQALDDLGLADNTLVLFVSDNGPHYPGMISTLYDRGVATPMVVRWPGKIKPGTNISHMINTIDIMPTFLEAAGIKPPKEVQGRSFLPLMTGQGKAPTREAVFLEMTWHVHYIPCRAVRTGRYKYIKNYSDNPFGLDMNNHDRWAHRLCELPGHNYKTPRPPEELYDLGPDPTEMHNLAENKEYAKVKQKLAGMLKEHMKETGDPFLGKPFTHDFDPERYEPVEPGTQYF